jgi:carbonic anhydrase/acetyltransferase-like protein (isoleucine patch superfamily)
MDHSLRFRPELVADSAYIAPNATVCGDVELAERASIWFGAVVRGDTESIRIGPETNIQDLAVVHADPGFPCQIGARVTVGHAAIVHGAKVDDEVLIGMRAVLLNGATIGAGSVVAAGSVVLEGMVVPPGSLVAGMPARIKREVDADVRARILAAAAHYVELAQRYREST